MNLNELITSAEMDDFEQEELISESKEVYARSVFNFLSEHNGYRPGKIHLLMAPTSAGKSTTMRSLLWDYCLNTYDDPLKCRVLVWLSEESSADFRMEYAKLKESNLKTRNIHIVSEQDKEMSLNNRKRLFEHAINTINPHIIFFDNLTTSEFYAEKTPKEQQDFAKYLKQVAKIKWIPIVPIAHTSGGVQLGTRMLEVNDIRGAKGVVNLAEFVYILQTLNVYDEVEGVTKKFPILKIHKHRGYVIKNSLFQFKFNPLTLSFQQDRVINWEEFKNIFNKQNKL